MPILSELISQIDASPTLALNEKTKELRQSGADIINLSIGEPLNDFPQAAFDLALERLQTRQVKYTAVGGTAEMKTAVREYTRAHYGRTPELANITLNMGAKQSLYNLFLAIVNPQDEVLIFTPYWVSYPEIIKLVRGKPVLVKTNQNLVPEMEDILAAITPRTRAILLNSPNNPSGAVYPPELIAALVDFCESKGIYLVMDDIYHQLVFGPTEWVPGYVFTSKPIDKSHLVIINGISKTYGMTGFRIGWAIGPRTLISAMETIQSHTTSGASVLLQDAALGALRAGDSTLNDLQSQIRENRDILVSQLQKIPGVRLSEPQGTFYCFPDFRALQPDSSKLAELLLEKAFISTVPGITFGQEGFLRLSFTCSREEIIASAARIRWALDPGSPREITIAGKTHLRDWERF